MSGIKALIEAEARAAEEADPNTPIPEGTKVTPWS